MNMMNIISFFLFATIVATSQAAIPHQIHLLRPRPGSAGHKIPGVDCNSWRLAVETNNVRDWEVVPGACESYVGHYMLGHQYLKDGIAAAAAAYSFAKGIKLKGDGKEVWVFDIDETALSNLPYYARPDNAFGAKEFNETTFDAWELEGKALAYKPILHLYQRLLKLGYKIVFISGKSESIRKVTETNLKNVGYHTWEKLILKQTSDKGLTAVAYKSNKRRALVKQGYRIIGNMGDQWSDLLGDYVGVRTFKVPDPMYYIG